MDERAALKRIIEIAEDGSRSYSACDTATFSTEDRAYMRALSDAATFARESLGEVDPAAVADLRRMSSVLSPMPDQAGAPRVSGAVSEQEIDRLRSYSRFLGPGSDWAKDRARRKPSN